MTRYCNDVICQKKRTRYYCRGDLVALLRRRHQIILNAYGEFCVVYRKKTNGTRCSCWDEVRLQPALECPLCYGTGWADGYDIVAENIRIRIVSNPQQIILQESGFEYMNDETGMLIDEPRIYPNDMIYRSRIDRFYEVQSVKLKYFNPDLHRVGLCLLGDLPDVAEITRQEFPMKLIQTSDIIYKILNL